MRVTSRSRGSDLRRKRGLIPVIVPRPPPRLAWVAGPLRRHGRGEFTPLRPLGSGSTEQTGYAHDMAALGWLTPRKRSATARSVLAGEASAEAARKSSQEAPETPQAAAEEPQFPVIGDAKAA